MAITPNTLFSSGAVLTADQMNRLPWGILASTAAVTANFTTSGTHTNYQDVTGYSTSVTYSANRILRVSFEVAPYVPGGSNNLTFKVLRGTTDIKEFDIVAEALQGTFGLFMTLSATFTGPAAIATETFKVQMKAKSVNSQVGTVASSAYPGRLYVEDLGAA